MPSAAFFGEEPIAVHAVGTKTPTRGFNFQDTVAVTLRFPEERVAQLVVSYAAASSESFELVGHDASIHASPCYVFADTSPITYVETSEDGEKMHTFDAVDQFANETPYFSDCILNYREPEYVIKLATDLLTLCYRCFRTA